MSYFCAFPPRHAQRTTPLMLNPVCPASTSRWLQQLPEKAAGATAFPTQQCQPGREGRPTTAQPMGPWLRCPSGAQRGLRAATIQHTCGNKPSASAPLGRAPGRPCWSEQLKWVYGAFPTQERGGAGRRGSRAKAEQQRRCVGRRENKLCLTCRMSLQRWVYEHSSIFFNFPIEQCGLGRGGVEGGTPALFPCPSLSSRAKFSHPGR